ncbi:hypothetical protein MHYP_G00013330 [Metynnis hypsauchen]
MEFRSLSVILLQIVFLHCGQTQGEPGSTETSDSDTPGSEKPNLTVRVDPQSSVDIGVTLICEVESTGWKFRWIKVSQLLQPQSLADKDSNTVRVTVSDEGTAEFICAAHRGDYSTETSDPTRRTVKVLIVLSHCGQTMKSGTPGLETHGQTKREEHQSSVCTGDTVTLICELESTGWEFLLSKSSQQFQPQSTDDKDTNTVSVTVSAEETTKTKCAALRGDYSTQLSDPAKITIKEKPNLTASVDTQSFVYTGDTVTLTCNVKQSTGWKFLWYNGSQQLQPQTPADKDTNTVSLTVSDEGTAEFKCEARRGVYHTQLSDPNMITAKERPRAVVSIQPVWVFSGETVTLRCDIQGGGDSDWQYSWFKDDPDRPVSNEQHYSISPVTESDRGEYTCRGTKRGTSRYSHTSEAVTLTVSERPKAVVSIQSGDQVFRGETVTLRCDIQGGGVSNWQYSWFKDDPSTPVSNKRQYSISSVTESHSGKYTCRGTERETSRSLHTSDAVTLTVSALPTATLTVEPRWSPVFTGESVTLKCEIQSYSYSRYQWYKGSSRTAVSQSQTKTITITSAADQGQYWCRGESYYRPTSSQPSNTVTLTVKALPTATLTVEPRWSPVFTGESVTLKCEIQSYSNWRYQWYKGSRRTAVDQSQTNTFTIKSAADQDQYWCRGERDNRPTSSQHSNTVTLTVKERPRAVVSIQPDDQVFIGENVTLTCDIQGGGVYNWQYSWFKDGSSTPVSEQQYSISSVTESHRGKYTCRGTERETSRSSHTSEAVTLTVSALPTATLTVEPRWSPVFTGESAADQDQYWCRGERDNRPTSSQNSNTVTLRVEERPRAVVTIQPGDQVFIGETVTLTCGIRGGGVYNWQYSWFKDGSSTPVSEQQYNISSVTESHRGEYTCRGTVRGTSRSSHTSEAVRLTVSAEKPKPELTSSHKGAALIGNPVSLNCKLDQSAGWKFYWSKHTQSPENEIKTETHSYTISSVSVSDEGQYWCRAGRGDPVYYTNYSDALWMNVTGVSPEVSLIVNPSRTQHFITDSLSLSCEGQSDSTGWRVRRYTHSEKVLDCSSGWGSVTGSTCNISSLNTSHTGVYWCESESGESSNPVNVTVNNGAVILDSPVHPVTEGDPLTLRCLYRDPKPSNHTAEFYKNGSLLQTQTTGEMTIRTVSKSDEGLYHCKHPEKGESPQSWISVRGSNRLTVILVAVALSLILFLIVMLCLICCCKKKKGNKNNTSQTSGQSQNTGSTLLQPGNDHVYGNVGVMANTTTDDSAAGSSDVTYAHVLSTKKKLKTNDDGSTDATYAQVLSTKNKQKRKGGSAAGYNDATYVQVMSTEKKLKTNDDSADGSSDATYAQVLSIKKKPKKRDVAVTTPNDLTYSQIEMKHLKSHSENDVMPGPSDTVYSQIQEKKPKGKGASKYSEAEPSDVTYAEIDLKDKKPKKNQVKGKIREEADTVYSELK